MNIPLVSIIVPIFGVEKYIAKCAESLFVQTYPNIEYIFVNDCTKDNSIQILNEIISDSLNTNKCVRLINHDTNLGLAAARKTGIINANGDFILHVDSDDWIEPETVEKLVAVAQEQGADIVVCGTYIERISKRRISLPYHYTDKMDFIHDILLNIIPGSSWGKLIKTALLKDHPNTFPISGINHGEDYVTIPRIIYYSNHISFVDLPLYHYNCFNQTSYTHSISEKSVESLLKADAVLEKFFLNKIDKTTLVLMKLRTKLALIKQADYRQYNFLSNIYSDIPKQYIKYLSWKDRLLLVLIGNGLNRQIAYFVHKYLDK